MPVFREESTAARELRAHQSLELPLPRLFEPPSILHDGVERYEVVVVGVSVPADLSQKSNIIST